MKLYGFLWHVNTDQMTASEGAAGSHCESAETDKPSQDEAVAALKKYLDQREAACKDPDCEHSQFVTEKVSLKMLMAGMTARMAKVE